MVGIIPKVYCPILICTPVSLAIKGSMVFIQLLNMICPAVNSGINLFLANQPIFFKFHLIHPSNDNLNIAEYAGREGLTVASFLLIGIVNATRQEEHL